MEDNVNRNHLWEIFTRRNNLDSVGQEYNNENILESLVDVWNAALEVKAAVDVKVLSLIVGNIPGKEPEQKEYLASFLYRENEIIHLFTTNNVNAPKHYILNEKGDFEFKEDFVGGFEKLL